MVKSEAMGKLRRSGKQRANSGRTHGRRRMLAIVLLLSVVSAGAILGPRLGASPQMSRKKPGASQQDAAITPASFDSPAKEYISAGES